MTIMVNSSRGRPAGPSTTRRRLVEAAEQEFARHGYAGASTRSVARTVGVSHTLVNYYFGDKEGLFNAVLDVVMSPGQVLERVATEATVAEFPARLLTAALTLWDAPPVQQRLVQLLRGGGSDPDVADALRGYLQTQVVGQLSEFGGGRGSGVAAAAVMAGLFVTRYVLRLEPIATMGRREVVEAMTPTLRIALSGRATGPGGRRG